MTAKSVLGRILKYYDWIIFLIILILLTLSLLVIYSLDLGREGGVFLNFRKQAIFAILALGIMFLFAFIDWRFFKNLVWPLYFLGLLMLWGVLFFGETRRATTGWFALGGFVFQPVEIAKIFFILAMADLLSKKGFIPNLKLWLQFFILLLLYLIPVTLQPDLGGAFVLAVIGLGMFLMVGLPKRYLLGLLFLGIVTALIGWFFILHNYQRERILVFLNPGRDPLGRGYNISQAIVAIGSGGLWGHGFGGGSQSQLRFLPEAQTDFIFAVLAEELGLIGVVVILGAQLFLFYRIILVAKRLSDNFSLFFLVGALILLGIETVTNIGMNLGLLPIAGLTLPFVSLGGSSLISKSVLIGIIQSMRIRSY
jgi:rod shape determining protein RodA